MTTDRDFLERLGRLAGQTTYRVPVEGIGTRFSHLPESHALAAALSFARGKRWNPGPELLYAVATGVPHRSEEVVSWLIQKMRDSMRVQGDDGKKRIHLAATIAYVLVIRGNQSLDGVKIPMLVARLANIGASWLSACMDEALARAERQGGDEEKTSPREAPETA